MESAPAQGERPLISVIITSYNYAHYLSESISSVLSQNVPDLELIVVDNASTDTTDQVVAGFTADPRLRYYKNATNIGLTPNHRRGLELARGDYIAFLSADDALLPGHLRRCLDYLQAHPAIDMVYTGTLFMDAQSRPYDVRNMMGQLPVDYDGGRNEFAAQLTEGCYVPWPSMLARRSLYDELGTLHQMTAADYEITVRWAAARRPFGYLRTPSVVIRLHASQASGNAYIADGRDLGDYVEILEKFIVPENWDLLQSIRGALAKHVGWRVTLYRDANGTEVLPEMQVRINDVVGRILAIPELPVREQLGNAPLISVIVRCGTVMQLIAGLRSLAEQVDAPAWEAIVVSEGGPDFEPLVRRQGYGSNVRFVRLDQSFAPSAARNVGQRLAGGRVITYLEPGNAFTADHLANLARAFDTGVMVVRSEVRFLLAESHDGSSNTIYHETTINGLYRGETDEDRDLVAATVPVDAIAHLASAVERIGRFREDIAVGEVWEYWLRLKALNSLTFVPGPSVIVRKLRNDVLPNQAFLTLVNSIYHAYPVPPESPVQERRVTYLKTVGPHFERGAAAIVDTPYAIEVLAALLGIEDAVVKTERV